MILVHQGPHAKAPPPSHTLCITHATDVPGLLEGAHEGVGLGHAFLRHVSRCRTLLHLLDGTSPDPIGDYKAIRLELELFNPALLDKPQARWWWGAQGGGQGTERWHSILAQPRLSLLPP